MCCEDKLSPENPLHSKEKEDVKMALLATPIQAAICIDEKNAGSLQVKNTAILDALREIRRMESSTGSPVRLERLDARINSLENTVEQEQA